MKLLLALAVSAVAVGARAEGPAAHSSDMNIEVKLRVWAAGRKIEKERPAKGVPAGFSEGDKAGLRDAPAEPSSLRREISIAEAAEKSRLERRLPGMSEDPFDVCRTLERCAQAPRSFHVEDEALIPDALVALSRPWIALEKARGRRLLFTPTSSSGEKIATLEVSSGSLEIHAAPAETGGYDVWLVGATDPAKRFAAEKEIVLQTFR
jgi:hypothetical protein